MSDSYKFGMNAEKLAAEYLQQKNYLILDRNFIFQKAEIDIIAIKNDILCIIEVKALSYNTIKQPSESVNSKKQKLLIKAADFYIQQKNINLNVRFDIISIIKNNDIYSIEHIKDAFYFF